MPGDTGKGKRSQSIATRSGSVDEGAEYTAEEVRYLKAVEAFKTRARCRFPTAVDLLRVAVRMGYRPPCEVAGLAVQPRESCEQRVAGEV